MLRLECMTTLAGCRACKGDHTGLPAPVSRLCWYNGYPLQILRCLWPDCQGRETKTSVFGARKSSCPSFCFNGDVIDQIDEFRYLGVLMHGTKGLGPAFDYLCKAANRAMLINDTRRAFPGSFQQVYYILQAGQFQSLSNCNRVANFQTWVRPKQTLNQVIIIIHTRKRSKIATDGNKADHAWF